MILTSVTAALTRIAEEIAALRTQRETQAITKCDLKEAVQTIINEIKADKQLSESDMTLLNGLNVRAEYTAKKLEILNAKTP